MAETFIEYNYCVESYEDEGSYSSKKCTLTLTNGLKVGLSERCSKYTKVDDCTDSAQLQMTVQDYNFLMGVTSNMIGFTLVFLVGFLFVLQGRR